MNNIFAVGTPLQLFAAYTLVNHDFKGQVNQIILLGSEKFWYKSPATRQMATDTELWSRIIIADKWLEQKPVFIKCWKQLKWMKSILLEHGKIDRFFLGADKNIKHQLLVELAGLENYVRLDDGVWSYYCPDQPFLNKIGDYLLIQFFKKASGIDLNMTYNLGGVGYGKAATGDYLFKPELLERYSPHPMKLSEEAIRIALDRLNIPPILAFGSKNAVLFLGGTFVEKHKVAKEQEIKILKALLQICTIHNMKLVYKPHPRERMSKLREYQDLIPEITFLVGATDPIEIILGAHPKIRWIVAHSSSGLLFADEFSRGIKSIALFKLYPNYIEDPILERLMIKGGVIILDNMDDMDHLFNNEDIAKNTF